jgi:hypothetical protein
MKERCAFLSGSELSSSSGFTGSTDEPHPRFPVQSHILNIGGDALRNNTVGLHTPTIIPPRIKLAEFSVALETNSSCRSCTLYKDLMDLKKSFFISIMKHDPHFKVLTVSGVN